MEAKKPNSNIHKQALCPQNRAESSLHFASFHSVESGKTQSFWCKIDLSENKFLARFQVFREVETSLWLIWAKSWSRHSSNVLRQFADRAMCECFHVAYTFPFYFSAENLLAPFSVHELFKLYRIILSCLMNILSSLRHTCRTSIERDWKPSRHEENFISKILKLFPSLLDSSDEVVAILFHFGNCLSDRKLSPANRIKSLNFSWSIAQSFFIWLNVFSGTRKLKRTKIS